MFYRLFGASSLFVLTRLFKSIKTARRFYESIDLSRLNAFAGVYRSNFCWDCAAFCRPKICRGCGDGERPCALFHVLCAPTYHLALWWFCRIIHKILGSSQKAGLYLSREELQKILEGKDEEEFNTIASHIFTWGIWRQKSSLRPLSSTQMIPSICTVSEMRTLLNSRYFPVVPIYHKQPENIIAIAYPRDLLRLWQRIKKSEEIMRELLGLSRRMIRSWRFCGSFEGIIKV